MGFFDKLGGNLIADRIRSEALKAVDKYAETAFINSILPHCGEDGVSASVQIAGSIDLSIAEMVIEYTEHMGRDAEKTLTLPPMEKHIAFDTLFRAVRPGLLADSETISAEGVTLNLNGRIAGIGMKQMMMSVGATVNAVSFRLALTGGATGKWLCQPAPETGAEPEERKA